eukprot:13719996-Heterocapsa_arctica.AAC.1
MRSNSCYVLGPMGKQLTELVLCRITRIASNTPGSRQTVATTRPQLLSTGRAKSAAIYPPVTIVLSRAVAGGWHEGGKPSTTTTTHGPWHVS